MKTEKVTAEERVAHTPGKWKVDETVRTHVQREAGFTYREVVSPNSAMWLAKVQTFHNSELDPNADAEGKANAAFIVTACNAHEKLVEALTYAIGELQAFYDASCDGRIKNTVTIGQFGRLETCRAALSLATQKGDL